MKIRPDDFATITGVTYDLSGFPEWMCDEGVGEFLKLLWEGTRLGAGSYIVYVLDTCARLRAHLVLFETLSP